MSLPQDQTLWGIKWIVTLRCPEKLSQKRGPPLVPARKVMFCTKESWEKKVSSYEETSPLLVGALKCGS